MFEYLITFVLAFIIAFCATPMAKRLAIKVGAIDIPKDERRMHKKPIALMGGCAIIAGFVISVFFNTLSTSKIFTPGKELLGLMTGAVIISVMGILDDIRPLDSKVKLLFQIMAAVAVVLISDSTRITMLTNPFVRSGVSFLSPEISYPLTILWIIGVTNAINLIDGLDGLAAGVSSISSLSLFFVSILRPDALTPALTVYTAVITAALAGSTLGFLPFNFNPAKIFMGETGSAFLGFTLGVISIQGTLKQYAAISITIPLLILGLPLFDTIFAIFRRILHGKSIMQADRGHLHHRLMDMGLSQRQSVVIMYTASAALGLCAIVLADRGALSAIILLLSVSIFVIGGARYMSDLGSGNEDGEQENGDENVNAAEAGKIPPEASTAVENPSKGAVK